MRAGEKILVVDDDEIGRHIKTHILKRAGYHITEAALGREAIDLTRHDRPDLVLLDVKLPDISGIEVCRQIKSSQPEVIVLQTSAAFVGAEDRAHGLDGGADAYLAAPIEPAELLASVGALMRLSRAERQLREMNEDLERQVTQRTQELAAANARLREEIQQRKVAEETLLHAQKLDALGQLTGGIAHDFNNLLTVILGNLELIRVRISGTANTPKERLLRFVDASRQAASQCAYLTRQLLAFARRDALRVDTIDLNEAVDHYASLLQRVIGEQIKLELLPAPTAWPCQADPAQLEAAVLNLAVNSRDAMPEGGTLRIEVRNVRIVAGRAPDEVPAPKDIAPGEYVTLCCRDTGTGMPAEVLSHAFEPFFTTKEVGKGSGLGLSQVYGFIRQSGGAIGVESRAGEGTAICLFLPHAKDARVKRVASAEAGVREIPGGRETILIVEDNDLVLSYTVSALEELGYKVLQAEDGPAAMEIICGPERIDLLFSDVVMPKQMSGVDLARKARERRPGLKVLLTSGYSRDEGERLGGPHPSEFRYIAKPYQASDLAVCLRDILEKKPATNDG
jgi:signal transduction histidine kinase